MTMQEGRVTKDEKSRINYTTLPGVVTSVVVVPTRFLQSAGAQYQPEQLSDEMKARGFSVADVSARLSSACGLKYKNGQSFKKLHVLLGNGGDLRVCVEGVTPLNYCAMRNNTEAFDFFINHENNAMRLNPFHPDERGDNVLHAAAYHGNQYFIVQSLNCALTKLQLQMKHSRLNPHEIKKQLLEMPGSDGDTVLLNACKGKQLATVKTLIESYHVDVSMKNKKQQDALAIAIQYYGNDDDRGIRTFEILRYLMLDRQMNIANGKTPAIMHLDSDAQVAELSGLINALRLYDEPLYKEVVRQLELSDNVDVKKLWENAKPRREFFDKPHLAAAGDLLKDTVADVHDDAKPSVLS